MTDLGLACRECATIEGQRRYCKSDGNVVLSNSECPQVILTNRELKCALLDLRTMGSGTLVSSQRVAAVKVLKEEYTIFAKKAFHFMGEKSNTIKETGSQPWKF